MRARRKSKSARRLPAARRLKPGRMTVLRERNGIIKQSLQQLPSQRVVQMLHAVLRLEPKDFVWQLHEQLLNREPSRRELNRYVKRVRRSTDRIDMTAQILLSAEAQNVISQLPRPEDAGSHTVAGIIRSFIHAKARHFTDALYVQLLSRYPDEAGARSNLQLLTEGVPRAAILSRFFVSAECRKLLSKPSPPVQLLQPAKGGTHIGIFLGFDDKVSLQGEGIGRFSGRLAEGLLAHSPDTVLYAAAAGINYEEADNLMDQAASAFPGRLFVLPIQDMDWVNLNIPVDHWIVPYAGMPLAAALNKPIVLCLHDMVYRHFMDDYMAADPNFVRAVDGIATSLAHQAAAVVFNSEFIRNHEGLQFVGLPADKTHVIRLAPPSEEYGNLGIMDEFTFRRKYDLHSPYIVYPSVIRLHKNHDRLVEAFLQFRQTPAGRQSNLQLVMTDSLDHMTSHSWPRISTIVSLLNGCQDPEARSSIRFIGRLPTEDLPSLYKYANGTIIPTLFEGSCPFPILESLIMNTPVAMGRLEVTREVIPAIHAFPTFDPYSVSDMHAAIHALAVQGRNLLPAEKLAISDALKRNWSDVAHEYYSLIKNL